MQNYATTYRRVALSLVVVSLSLMFGCFPAKDNPLNVNVLDPVELDWDAIKDRGSLRLITRYNSISYFLHNGVEHGFEYDFLKTFADENELALEVVIVQEHQNPIDLLNSGEGDVIAANYTINEQRSLYHAFSNPYNRVSPFVVLPESKAQFVQNFQDLADIPISVRKNSSYYYRLMDLKDQGYPIDIEVVSEDWDTEAIIMGVSNGEFEATVADDNLFYAAQTYLSGIALGPKIADLDSVAWGIRANSPMLKQKLDAFVDKHYRIGDDNQPKRSAILNILLNRYFEDNKKLFAYKTASNEAKYAGVLSPFDNLIRPIADSMGVDWKMIVSIAAQESKFDPYAKSWAGAIGLMQVNKRFSKYSEQELYDLDTNIREGIRILKENLEHYSYLDEKNRWALALATYNAGVGHVTDARRIAMDLYKDPNSWVYVEDALLKLMKRQYYKDARYGFCRGIETVKYVKEVLNRHEMYTTILSISERADHTLSKTIIGMGKMIN
ncbi:transporter substrate-binding domain-containing protein [bacterium]|nr:MAG: transporter substrate-binding domain-containing protein [bacterium]